MSTTAPEGTVATPQPPPPVEAEPQGVPVEAPAPEPTAHDIAEERAAVEAEPSAGEAPAEQAVNELDIILPELTAGGSIRLGETEIQLKNEKQPGVECKVAIIRTRQLLQIGRVLTGHTRPINVIAMLEPLFSAQTNNEQQAAFIAMIANLLITVPHSEQEFMVLVNTLTEPISRMDKDETSLFWNYMNNPEPLDAMKVMAQAFTNDRHRVVELGKALMQWIPFLQRAQNQANASQS